MQHDESRHSAEANSFFQQAPRLRLQSLAVLPVFTVQVRHCEPFSHCRVRLILLPNFLEPAGRPVVFAAVEIRCGAALRLFEPAGLAKARNRTDESKED